eukprot:gnl/TRDRNA2_/TRDRNA2_161474_c1_seq1.p1 gnl/TRDRNA2_/TRDRNA2_161474_c1~~gnl/TRDRNA2_/TRDRNA2_161474_c1_seq1.p1  ORF type:complete len:440 (+),score=26.91 gnl/TRDRNA2_/TRDRNA2_161474_c1_seq1:346-1665(+)
MPKLYEILVPPKNVNKSSNIYSAQEKESCPRYESSEVRSFLTHLTQYFNPRSTRPIGDGLSLWQLSIVQALRYGSTGLVFPQPIRSAGEAAEADVTFHAISKHRSDAHLNSTAVRAQEQFFQSVPLSKWLEILKWYVEAIREVPSGYKFSKDVGKTSWDMLPNARHALDDSYVQDGLGRSASIGTNAHSLERVFVGDPDIDFVVLGNYSDRQFNSVLRAYEKQMNNDGHHAFLMQNLIQHPGNILPSGAHPELQNAAPDKWLLVLTKEPNAIGRKDAREEFPRMMEWAFRLAFKRVLPQMAQHLTSHGSTLLSVFSSHLVVFDFWAGDKEYFREPVMAHPTRQMHLYGASFPFPKDWDTKFFHALINTIVKVPHGNADAKSQLHTFCDFYLPQGFWPDDFEPTDEARRVTRLCGQELIREGAFTFAEVCEPPDLMHFAR